MTNYIAVVCKDDDSAYGVWFPDVPNCVAIAETADGVLDRAGTALSLALKGLPLPEARDIKTIEELPEVANDLAAGASLLTVPFSASELNPVRIVIWLDPKILDLIDTSAEQRGMTRSDFIAMAAFNESNRG